MTGTDEDADFAEAVSKRLKSQEQAVPGDVAARLSAARRNAIAEMDAQHARWLNANWLVPAGAAATAVLALALLWPRGPELPPLAEFDESEYAAASEMELLDEIELIAWMLEEDSNAG